MYEFNVEKTNTEKKKKDKTERFTKIRLKLDTPVMPVI